MYRIWLKNEKEGQIYELSDENKRVVVPDGDEPVGPPPMHISIVSV